MKIAEVDVYDLKPSDYNPRTLKEKEYNQIKKSLEKYGFVEPVIANSHKGRENVIIGGHQRVSVAKDLGLKKVPVFYVKANEEDEKELNIRLNRNTGSFDMDKLANLFDSDDLLDWGFEEWELGFSKDDMKEDIETEGEHTWDDNVPKISYTIIFNTEQEQEKWFEFMRLLKNKYNNINTLSERLVEYMEENPVANI